MLRRRPNGVGEQVAKLGGQGAGGDQLVGVGARAVKRRIESAGPSTESGGITTLTREPSASRASTIGLSSSTRRPRGARIRSIASRSASSDVEPHLGRLDPPAALDVDLVGPVDHHLLDRGVREQLLERARGRPCRAGSARGPGLGAAPIAPPRARRTSSATAPSRSSRRRLRRSPRRGGARPGAVAGRRRAPRRGGRQRPRRANPAGARPSPRQPLVAGSLVSRRWQDRGPPGRHHKARGGRDRQRRQHRGCGTAAASPGRSSRAGGRVDPGGERRARAGRVSARRSRRPPARCRPSGSSTPRPWSSADRPRPRSSGAATRSTLAKADELGATVAGPGGLRHRRWRLPVAEAARIEVEEVRRHLAAGSGLERVVFAVFASRRQTRLRRRDGPSGLTRYRGIRSTWRAKFSA